MLLAPLLMSAFEVTKIQFLNLAEPLVTKVDLIYFLNLHVPVKLTSF